MLGAGGDRRLEGQWVQWRGRGGTDVADASVGMEKGVVGGL